MLTGIIKKALNLTAWLYYCYLLAFLCLIQVVCKRFIAYINNPKYNKKKNNFILIREFYFSFVSFETIFCFSCVKLYFLLI